MDANWYVIQLRRTRPQATNRALNKQELKSLWRAREEEYYEQTAERMVSARIFRTKSLVEIEAFRKALGKCTLTGQRALLRWVLNRRNPTKRCPRCQNGSMKKAHMEECVLNDYSAMNGFNSRIEARLSDVNYTDHTTLQLVLETAIRAITRIENVELRS